MPRIKPKRMKVIEIASNEHLVLPVKEKLYVSVYSVTRQFGGHEEGGWYYDWYEHVATYPRRVKSCRLPMVWRKMREKYAYVKTSRRGRWSVLGGADLVIVNERVAGEAISKERPHYE